MFRYNDLKLLECIKDRPCLWDKTVLGYKARGERKAAWDEVFQILDARYDEMTEPQKREVSNIVINKWANVRDTFVKSVKMKGKKRRYIYHDQLQFLLKVIPQAEVENDNTEIETDNVNCTSVKQEDGADDSENLSTNGQKHSLRSDESTSSDCERKRKNVTHPRKSDKKRQKDSPQDHNPQTVEVEIDCTPVEEIPDNMRVMNEDEAFFASLLPTVVRYDEDERLEFRMAVLAVMKKIKDSKDWQMEETITGH